MSDTKDHSEENKSDELREQSVDSEIEEPKFLLPKKKKRKIWWIIVPVIILGFGIGGYLFYCQITHTLWSHPFNNIPSNEMTAEEYVYVCPMGHGVWDHPGNCPVCGMQLVKKKKGEVRGSSLTDVEASTVSTVSMSPVQRVLANVATEVVKYKPLTKNIVTVGRITYDETKLAHVASWISGRIDKLYVNFTGDKVQKGKLLSLIYSPELVSTQEEYLLALDTRDKLQESKFVEISKGSDSLVEASRKRLKLWGITDKQIRELERTRKTKTDMEIYSPISGVVINKMVQEGQYVKQGDILYNIADLSKVWMEADIYEYEMENVHLGQHVEITSDSFPGEVFSGKITFIYPFLDNKSRTIRVRAELSNPRLSLKPDMYVNAAIKVYLGNRVLAAPASSILDTGMRKIAWVEVKPDTFEPRDVVTGTRAGDYYEILSGLKSGDHIVTQAGFLIDSEAQLMQSGGSSMPGMDMKNKGNGNNTNSSSEDETASAGQEENENNMAGMKM